MLRLARPTDPAWASRIASHMDEVLLDHAHLEKKAASTALQLMFRYPNDEALMRPLSVLAREELEHFELVLALLEDRGVAFEAQIPSAYPAQLHKAVRKAEPDRFLDTLLCCALIEARSCERMKLLSGVLEEPLASFYGSLVESEARHHSLYVDHAITRFGKDVALARLTELASHESDVMESQPVQARLHSS